MLQKYLLDYLTLGDPAFVLIITYFLYCTAVITFVRSLN